MATSRVTDHDYLLWVYAKLVESKSHDPAVDLETIVDWDWEGILWSQTVVNTKYDRILLCEHIGPLSRVVRVHEATLAHKSTTVKVQDYLPYLMLQVLLGS